MSNEIETTTNSVIEQVAQLHTSFQREIEMKNAEAFTIGRKAFDLAKESGNKEWISKTCKSLSLFYTDTTSEFAKSVAVLEEGIALLDDKLDTDWKGEFFRCIGLNYDFLGELIKSKQAYDESIGILSAKKDLSDFGKLTLARSLFNLSIIYGRLELKTLAHKALYDSYEQYKALDNKAGIARCYISFGVAIEDEEGSRQDALDHYHKAADLSKEINDDVSYSVAVGNMAIINAELGNFDESLKCAFDALEKTKRSANKKFLLNLYRQIGRCYHLKKDFEESNKWFAEAEKLMKELGLAVDYYDMYKYWSEMLFDAGIFKEAYEKLLMSLKQQEELHKFHKAAAVSDVTLQFQLSEGKKEQELLMKKNSEIEEYVRKLEVSNFELNQFAHVASHDLKEPLRILSNYAQLLTRSYGDQMKMEQAAYLHYINDGAKRMMDTINSLLQLSKINSNTKRETIDMNGVVEEIKSILKPLIEQKHAQIYHSKLPKVIADRTMVLQLLQNLISNGMKYNKSENPEIHIEHFEDEKFLRFEISDNGIGIPQQYREKVFIIFHRLHSREEYEGSGIGLAICKKIVDSMNGKIWIEDSYMGGTKFCFTIPK